MNRRRFLKASLWTAVGLSAGFTPGCSDAPLPATNLRVLDPQQQQLFQRMIQLLLPVQDTDLVPTESVPVLANIDHLFAVLDKKLLGDLSLGIRLFEYAPLVTSGHFSRFTRLDDASAIAYVEAWQNGNSIQRGIVTTIKKLVYACYWREEKTWAAVEFDGPVSDRWGLPSLGNAPLPAEVAS